MNRTIKKIVFCCVMLFLIFFAFFISYNWVSISKFAAGVVADILTSEGTQKSGKRTIIVNSPLYYEAFKAREEKYTKMYDKRPGNGIFVIGIIFMLGILYLCTPGKNNSPPILPKECIPMAAYTYSLLYAALSIILDPLEFIVAVCLFFFPLIKYYRKEITGGRLAIICLALIVAAYPFDMLGGFIVLIPTLHLIAIRTNNALKSRYSNEKQKLEVKLSSTQRKQIHRSWFYTLTWWDIIEPEIDEILNSWKEQALKPVLTGNGSSESIISFNDSTEYYEVDIEKEKDRLISLQSKEEKEIVLDNLIKRDKNFNEKSFLSRFDKLFEKIILATGNQTIETIQSMISDSLYEQFKSRIEEQKAAGIKFKTTEVFIHDSFIARLDSSKDFDEIHVKVFAQINEQATDIATGESLSLDSKSLTDISEIWTFIRRPSAKTLLKPGLLESSCPNCGSPIQIGQATICPNCNSYIRSGSYDWVLAQISQACEWKYANPQFIPNWNDICKQDKHLCIQHLEDKAALTFWIMKNLERNRNIEPLLRFADPSFFKNIKRLLMLHKTHYKCYENISLGSVSLRVVNSDDIFTHIYLLVLWSGVDVNYTDEGRLITAKRIIKPHREIYILKRRNNIQTKLDNTLSSAHCPNCGGPLTSSFDVKCQFCGTILNDASEWILENIVQESDKQYSALLNNRNTLIRDSMKSLKTKENKIIETNLNQVNKFSSKSASELIASAAQIILADGVITDSEMESYNKLCKKYEISEEKGLGILEAVKSGEYVPEIVNKKGKEAAILIQTSIEMALADGIIQPEEQAFIDNFAQKLGYNSADIKLQTSIAKRKIEANKAKEKEILERKKLAQSYYKNI